MEFVRCLGPQWLERNQTVFIRQVLELATVSGKGADGSGLAGTEIVHIRRCIMFILRATLGKLLGEKAQTSACKDLGLIIVTVTPLFTLAAGIMEPMFAAILDPCVAARIAVARCLRCVAGAVPSLLTPLIYRCLNRLEHLKGSPEAISGYSLSLAAMMGGCYRCPLGIPYGKGRRMFAVAEELQKTATQSSRLATVKTQAAWILLASTIMTLGPSVIKHHPPSMLLLWRNAFPRSPKEAEAEKQRSDNFIWQVTLESRAAGTTICGKHTIEYCTIL